MADDRIISRSKFPILSIVLLNLIIFLVVANSYVIIHKLSNYYKKESLDVLQSHKITRKIKSTFDTQISHRAVLETGEDDGNQSSLLPPLELTEEERILWFKSNLLKFNILESNDLTQKFHGRILEFFNQKCDVQFFMTWISPAAAFGRRELFALDSLFKAHPDGCLIILSKTLDSVQGYRILKPFLDRNFRILAVTPDLPFLLKNTPAESWLDGLKKGDRDPGKIPLAQNLSNLVRLAVLYKYGGVYLDTDFIVLKSFKGLRNSIGAQSINIVTNKWTRLNNAVLIFDINHPLLFMFMEEFAATFNGNKWGYNGPYLVSRVVEKVQGMPGYNLTVLPHMAFYPVDWSKIDGLFRKPESRDESRWVKAKILQLSGETYAIHLWNKQSGKLVLEEGSIIQRLIADHCVICEITSNA